MQAISVYLYSNKVDVFTNALAAWQTERYRRVYNRNLRIYRSVDNRIDLQVRNSDQKAADTNGSALVFNLINRDTNDLVITKTCEVVNAGTGRYYVILTEAELFDIASGFYNYTVTQEVRSSIDSTDYTVSSRTPLYIDSQYGAIATLEIVGDVLGDAEPSLEINKFEYINPATTGDPEPAYYNTSIIDTQRNLQTAQSLHTFQFYTTGYTGNIKIQGSISEDASPSVWTDIESINVTNSNIKYANIVGKWNYFRIRYSSTAGKVDKVLYR